MLKILVPLDGSPEALAAVRHVLALQARGLRARCLLVNVQAPSTLYELMTTRDPDVLHVVAREAGAHALAAGEAMLGRAGEACLSEVVVGEPAHAILDLAAEHGCAAIVMTARGAGTLREALLGSVSQAVLHDATLPVTIVREAAAEGEGEAAPA